MPPKKQSWLENWKAKAAAISGILALLTTICIWGVKGTEWALAEVKARSETKLLSDTVKANTDRITAIEKDGNEKAKTLIRIEGKVDKVEAKVDTVIELVGQHAMANN